MPILSKWYKDWDRVFQKSTHGFLAYFASKQMQLMMTLHLAEELKGDGIAVNAFQPGVVATEIWRGETPMMRTVTGKFFEKLGQEIHLGPRFRIQTESAVQIDNSTIA